MTLKIKLPAKLLPTSLTPPAAPRMKITLPPRGPSVLGEDEDGIEFLDADEGDIVFGDVVPEPTKAPNSPLKLLPKLQPSPGGKLKGLPVVKSSEMVLAEQQAAFALKRTPAPGATIPPLECSTCHVGASCFKFSEGDVCSFEKEFMSFDVRSTTGILSAMEMMLVQNLKRLQIMYLSEQMVSGGMADPQITRLSSEIQTQMMTLLNLRRQSQTVTVEASGPAAGGVLSRMFGKPMNSPSPIDLHPEEGESRVRVTMTRAQRMEAEED